jgi:hypothetical protein
MTQQTENNLNEIKRQMAENNIVGSFLSVSETNGISIYFEIDGVKCRFSDHSVTNGSRMQGEKHYGLPFVSKLGFGGVKTTTHNENLFA